MLPKIAFIGTGGTIASIGADAFDLLDYNASDERVDATTLIERTGLQGKVADVLPINFRQIDSTAVTNQDWWELAETCLKIQADPAINGIVIGHGTASLEETAWALSLVLDIRKPVILTGSMRPLTGISTDAHANLAAAVRAASNPALAGVFVVINDEIHSPRMVTKTHTLRLGAFQSPWVGPVGYIDGPDVRVIRSEKKLPSYFAHSLLRDLPRVDIAYSHIGADGIAIQSFVAAGARGIVSAGFGPGMATPAENLALKEAVAAGVIVVQSSRTNSGLVVDSSHNRESGIVAGSDIGPVKARILLALCLAKGDGQEEIERQFKAV
ncbi:asparaginase [Agrobacterium salinitolerans]|uniref:asparaginase n=1 Tax=Agrobacterium salinitolerans TaxID=1183413 RepID=UPI001573B7E8|nr:asparaginase [Agrobacterium salinitolerans]NTA40296.1 asparaginase [Agrobacterium salinitolerans]